MEGERGKGEKFGVKGGREIEEEVREKKKGRRKRGRGGAVNEGKKKRDKNEVVFEGSEENVWKENGKGMRKEGERG